MRVIGGKYRGHSLRSLNGTDIRPTSDRLRETLFTVLMPGNPEALQGTVWLDLFAGTGAVGIEALSRGAQQVYFVETSGPAVKVIPSGTSRASGIVDGYKIMRDDLAGVLWKLEREHVAADVLRIPRSAVSLAKRLRRNPHSARRFVAGVGDVVGGGRA